MSRMLREMGYRKLTARPRHHGQNGDAIDTFKKTSPPEIASLHARIGSAVPLEIWWQDEARVGQKNSITRRWAERGTRPVAPKDQRTKFAWIFGAICPPGVWGPRLFCRSVIHAGCNGTWKKYHHRSNPVPMLSSSLTRRAGTPPANWISRTISPSCRCRHVARNSIRSKMSGNICGKTGCQTGSLTIRTRSFPSVVTHGTTSPKDHGKSCPLDTENGHMGSDFQEMVLIQVSI